MSKPISHYHIVSPPSRAVMRGERDDAANVFCRLRFLVYPIFQNNSSEWPKKIAVNGQKKEYIQKIYETTSFCI